MNQLPAGSAICNPQHPPSDQTMSPVMEIIAKREDECPEGPTIEVKVVKCVESQGAVVVSKLEEEDEDKANEG